VRGERKIFGTWWDLWKSGTWFIDWIHLWVAKIFVREDYWCPEFMGFGIVEAVPNAVLDRNEVLLVSRRHPVAPVSVSWTMPLVVVADTANPLIVMARGASNCLMCAFREGPAGGFRCGNPEIPDPVKRIVSRSTLHGMDLGCCPRWAAEDSLELSVPCPVWWRDSDWPLAAYRYSFTAFDHVKVLELLQGEPVSTSIRTDPIPFAPYEVEKGIRARPPTKDAWLRFLEDLFTGNPKCEDVLRWAARREFDSVGSHEREA